MSEIGPARPCRHYVRCSQELVDFPGFFVS